MTASRRNLPARNAGRHARHTCENFVSVEILVRPKMRRFQVVMIDVSADGISFLHGRPACSRAPFWRCSATPCCRPFRGFGPAGSRMQPNAARKWLIGCELSPPFSEDEMADLSRPSIPATAA